MTCESYRSHYPAPNLLGVGGMQGPPVRVALEWKMRGVRPVQMVDRMDQGAVPPQVVAQSHEALWKLVSKALYRTHVEGKLKVVCSSPSIFTTVCDKSAAWQDPCLPALYCIA